jgi:molybdopterin-guanine dinucleotide biosynthesis protein A
MGRDKAEITYGEQPQWRAAADILAPICARTYWSCTAKQRSDWGIGEWGVLDHVSGHGPASGIHAAFLRAPDAAWIVIGCDYPLLETQDIRRLLEARAPEVDAVTFLNHQTAEIEPMISLWEPAAVQQFMERFAAGEYSPRRILQSCKLVTVMPRGQRVLHNRNSPTE